jgi:hypothetical protein
VSAKKDVSRPIDREPAPATLALEMALSAVEAERARAIEKYDRRIADLTRALANLAGQPVTSSDEPPAAPALKRGRRRETK